MILSQVPCRSLPGGILIVPDKLKRQTCHRDHLACHTSLCQVLALSNSTLMCQFETAGVN